MTTNKYEVEFEALFKNKNPEYYKELTKILSDFQNHLISTGIIENNKYINYVKLLKKISKDDKLKLNIDYDLKGSLVGFVEGLNKVMPSIESALIGQKYLNIDSSKNFLFSQKASELIQQGQELNRSKFADLILEIYDENDFDLTFVKLKILRFLDPNSNFVFYTYAGKPRPE